MIKRKNKSEIRLTLNFQKNIKNTSYTLLNNIFYLHLPTENLVKEQNKI